MSALEDRRRFEELAVSRFLDEHTAEEKAEYSALQARYPAFDESEIERLIAIAYLACAATDDEPLPSAVAAAVANDAARLFGDVSPSGPQARRPSPPAPARWFTYGGWATAAAASVVALYVGLHRPAAQLAAAAPKAPAIERSEFLAGHPRAIDLPWQAGTDATGAQASGDVVWDEGSQSGYMRFVGLRRNDPGAEQYQLWIFDGNRDQRFPVDGGVFNATGGQDGDVVAMHAKLKVRAASMFVVTVEPPGGVVVSDRSRIAALAKVK